ncbi:MAG: hypothetical protein PHW09_10260, partial [Desulfovibrio desulfuricans]|nr:hypothetical protein [Desulfovibrio desulfuricans]
TRYSLVNEPLGLFGPPARLVAAWREERLCPLSFPESTTFFRFAKVFRGDRQSFFSRREERLCSPSLSKSTTFFPFRKTFASPWSQSFSPIARSIYAPLRFRSQQLFSVP